MSINFGTTDVGNTPLPITDNGTSITVDGTVTANIGAVAPGDVYVELTATPAGVLNVDGSGVVQPVSGPLTDTQLRATPVPISGTVSVSGNVEVVNDVGNPIPVNGTVAATQSGTWNARMQDGAGTSLTATFVNGRVPLDTRRADFPIVGVTATGAASAAVTLTIPAAGGGVFHYLQYLEIVKYSAAAITGTATPIVVTTTNLPGTPAFTMGRAGAIGTVENIRIDLDGLRSSVANTATTIVCPAVTNVIWRVNVFYFTTG